MNVLYYYTKETLNRHEFKNGPYIFNRFLPLKERRRDGWGVSTSFALARDGKVALDVC